MKSVSRSTGKFDYWEKLVSAVIQAKPSNSLVVRLAGKYGIDADKMMHTLKTTAFKGEVTNEQMMALLVVAEQYDLNPWTKELYAFPQGGGIVPVVGVDGWSRIINTNPQFDGMDFEDGPVDAFGIPEWIKCTIHRKDRSHPISTKEYFAEVRRDTAPWKSHPRRMLRHKATIQCARLAFGFVGIYDPDEAERIIDVTPSDGGFSFPAHILTPEKRTLYLPKVAAAIEAGDGAKLSQLLSELNEGLQRGLVSFLSYKQKVKMRELLQTLTPPQVYASRLREALEAGSDERIAELHAECNEDAAVALEVSTLMTPAELDRVHEALDRARA